MFEGCSWWVCGKPVSEEPHSHDATAPADYDDYEPDDDSIAIDDDLEENNILNQEKNADFQRLVARVAQMKTESEKLSDQAKPHNLESNVDNINKGLAFYLLIDLVNEPNIFFYFLNI